MSDLENKQKRLQKASLQSEEKKEKLLTVL